MVSGARADQTCNGYPNCSLGTNAYTFGPSDVFGGGSSLIAPYWRQWSDCYGEPADLITKGSPPTFVDENWFDYTGTPPWNCATHQITSSFTTWYISSGSGSGILALFAHDPETFWGEVNTNGPQYFPDVHYAASEAGLGSADLNAYNNGGTYSQGGTTITIAAPDGLPCGNGEQGGEYPNPAECYGPLIQFPLSIDPVAIAYANGGVYEKQSGAGVPEIDFGFDVQHKNRNGGLQLSVASLCGIYNGQIQNWNNAQLTADNGGVSLEDPKDPTPANVWSVPLIPVARSDSSGTTSITTRHLANVCAGYGFNLYTTGATTISAAGAGSIVGSTYNVSNPNWPGVDQPGKITMAPNSSGVAQYVAFTQAPNGLKNQCSAGTVLVQKSKNRTYTDCIQQGRVGYIGADYVLPYVTESETNTYNLFSAALQNAAGQYVMVSPQAALAAFGSSAMPPQTTKSGRYQANLTQNGLRTDPTAWVQGLSPLQSIANPTGVKSYPVVGTTNFLGYTCYAAPANAKNPGVAGNLSGLIDVFERANIILNVHGLLGSSGLAPLPKAWTMAIDDAFVQNYDKLGLQISVASKTGSVSARMSSTTAAMAPRAPSSLLHHAYRAAPSIGAAFCCCNSDIADNRDMRIQRLTYRQSNAARAPNRKTAPQRRIKPWAMGTPWPKKNSVSCSSSDCRPRWMGRCVGAFARTPASAACRFL
jgi:ABC-type phosphate transport system substrate-binding protein